MADLHTNGTADRAPTGAQADVVTQVLAWWHDDRIRTHSVSCRRADDDLDTEFARLLDQENDR